MANQLLELARCAMFAAIATVALGQVAAAKQYTGISVAEFTRKCVANGGSVSRSYREIKCSYPNGRQVSCKIYHHGGIFKCTRNAPPRPYTRPEHNGGQTGNNGETNNPDNGTPDGTRPPSAGGAGLGAGSATGNTGNGGIN